MGWDLQNEIQKVKNVMKRHKFLSDYYQDLLAKVSLSKNACPPPDPFLYAQIDSKALDPNQLVDTLQTKSQTLKEEIETQKQDIKELEVDPARPGPAYEI